jgi:cytochrome c biogenesis protein CcdA/thiol-disulfide isomerase/thioredoxin
MVLLVLFALVAGAGTAITPCVLPVLPALLSASATGGRRRPLGIIVGLTVTFVVTIVGLASLIHGVGLADDLVRKLAVVVLIAFGVALVWPRLGDRLEARLSRLARFGPRDRGDGFRSGLIVGAALGFVYAPCAGPILAAVVSVAATMGASLKLVAVAIGYGVGSAAVLLAYAYGGRRILEPLRRAGRGPVLQRVLGVVMVLTAIAIATDLDLRFQTALANDLPDFLTNPTHGLERSHSVENRLASLRGRPRFNSAAHSKGYPVLGAAPEIRGGGARWFNTPGDRPLSLARLRGRVVLIDFWTYTCINCLRTLPYVRAWDGRYRRDGLTVIGVHTPEFGFEHDSGNVGRAVRRNKLRYPVVQDNDYAIWSAFDNQYWPAKYLIDTRGRIRYTHFGEGDYGKTESAIRFLLAASGSRRLGGHARARAVRPSDARLTPETYLGAERARNFATSPQTGTRRYPVDTRLDHNKFALGGTWRVTGESATAGEGARLDASINARRVYLVLAHRGAPARHLKVLIDGRPPRRSEAGADLHGAVVTVRGQRLYELLNLPRVERRRITLLPERDVEGFAFTFG